MKTFRIIFQIYFLLLLLIFSNKSYSANNDTIQPNFTVTLPEAHNGSLEIDTKLLDSYGRLPENIRQFYLEARAVFVDNPEADFSHPEIIKAAKKYEMPLMGGPLLGNLSDVKVVIWIRPSTNNSLVVEVKKSGNSQKKTVELNSVKAGVEQKIVLDGLTPDNEYTYSIISDNKSIAKGSFKTAPSSGEKGEFRLAFGSCFHKIGLHNPNLIHQIIKREPCAMMLLGDLAVDDRENQINMHRSDYLLRDVSKAWSELAAYIPLYTSWDDHDYFNNDLGGIPKGFSDADRKAVRTVWQENWNNPENSNPGIYFNSRVGPVEIIMLDTRSLRENERRGEYGAYLGTEQMKWLKETLKNSEASFKVISSGTMWSDYITPGKDSWGTWDTAGRKELFQFIENENISGVLLVSGDRHGTRGFTISQSSKFSFYEFQVASLGGVPGPPAMAKNSSTQLFGYHGTDIIAFGEFTFDTIGNKPEVTFRLIDEFGTIHEQITLPYNKLIPNEK